MAFNPRHAAVAILIGSVATASAPALAATWSDALIGYRVGNEFHDPGNDNSVRKHIVQFSYVAGYTYGLNYFNVDVLSSSDEDPANGSSTGATEFYLAYRHQLHLGKLMEQPVAFGPVKDVAITAGFDLQTKNSEFAPRKRMLVVGPTLKFDVPGFLDVSLLYTQEWNHCGLSVCANVPGFSTDHKFDPYPRLEAAWGVPFMLGSVPLKYQGFLAINGEKGKDYFNQETETETLFRSALMVDVGQLAYGKKNTFLMGVGYELWRNKFGNHDKPGVDTDAPTLNLEFHF
jgi:nucleoside-specific outer membrane channel protein Tsx